jgi:uncharacterized protein
VVLVTGSGPQDRDQTLFEHKPFPVVANYLTRCGVAVLRFDDRGFGKSGPFAMSNGDVSEYGSIEETFSPEALLAMLKWIRAQVDRSPPSP